MMAAILNFTIFVLDLIGKHIEVIINVSLLFTDEQNVSDRGYLITEIILT